MFFAPEVLTSAREERNTKTGGTLIYTVLTVRFTFFAEDGSSFPVVMIGEAMDSGDKSANKAMSAALKYALLQVFCIPTEEDKDTETQTHEVAPRLPVPVLPIAPAHSLLESPTGGSGAYCVVCSTELILSKNGTGYYCKKFKEVASGNHTRIRASDLEEFKAACADPDNFNAARWS